MNHGTVTRSTWRVVLCLLPKTGEKRQRAHHPGGRGLLCPAPCASWHTLLTVRGFLMYIYIYNLFSHLFIWFFGCAGCPLLCGFFSCYPEQGLPCRCVVQASHRGGFSCRAQALGTPASVVPARGLRSCGSGFTFRVAHGIFSDQGSNPCLLPWPASCIHLSPQGSARGLLEVDGEREPGWRLKRGHGSDAAAVKPRREDRAFCSLRCLPFVRGPGGKWDVNRADTGRPETANWDERALA